MGEVPKMNPRISVTENNASVGSCGSGTVGYKENVEAVNIPNVGKTVDAPKNDPAGWSAVNPYNK